MSSQERTRVASAVIPTDVHKDVRTTFDMLNEINKIFGPLYSCSQNPACDVERERDYYDEDADRMVHTVEQGRVLLAGIKHVVYVDAKEYPKPDTVLKKYQQHNISHKWFQVSDEPLTPANVDAYLKQIKQVITYLMPFMRRKENVLVHCRSGNTHSVVALLATMLELRHSTTPREKRVPILRNLYDSYQRSRPFIVDFEDPLIQLALTKWERTLIER